MKKMKKRNKKILMVVVGFIVITAVIGILDVGVIPAFQSAPQDYDWATHMLYAMGSLFVMFIVVVIGITVFVSLTRR